MKEWKHGGNVYEAARELGCNPEDILDLSASINPLGPPEGLRDVLFQHFNKIVHYPDINNKSLVEALSEYHGLGEGNIAVGNGSTELIYWLPCIMKWERVAIVLPTFSEYITAFMRNDSAVVKPIYTCWENGFQPTVAQLETILESFSPQVVVLTNPASPSGAAVAPQTVEFLSRAVERYDCCWVIDEVFVDFCEEFSLLPILDRSKNVVFLRSLTKFYSLPGLRLGYVLGDPFIVNKLKRNLPPWSVNIFSQMAGIFCLKDKGFRSRTLDFFRTEREKVFSRLAELSTLGFIKGVANYVLIRLEKNTINSVELKDRMLQNHKILIRDCSNFKGLSDRFVRIAVASKESNERWIEALKQELKDS